jgi:hypothetical protein
MLSAHSTANPDSLSSGPAFLFEAFDVDGPLILLDGFQRGFLATRFSGRLIFFGLGWISVDAARLVVG